MFVNFDNPNIFINTLIFFFIKCGSTDKLHIELLGQMLFSYSKKKIKGYGEEHKFSTAFFFIGPNILHTEQYLSHYTYYLLFIHKKKIRQSIII